MAPDPLLRGPWLCYKDSQPIECYLTAIFYTELEDSSLSHFYELSDGGRVLYLCHEVS